ncbi:MAG: class II fumarate hydratase [Lachnospiraceae bacterium]|nr:class II fumarate hydratase [Lachnospiraceae bacterium]
MEFRIERDSLGEMQVPADKYWGAQTERSLRNFPIGDGLEKMPEEMISALAALKRAAAAVNFLFVSEKMSEEKLVPLLAACDEVRSGLLKENFPLVVWQTGSGTQTNMNVNEVLANRANELLGRKLLHPNDDVNLSQSSNDVFPSAMHIAAVLSTENRLLPALNGLVRTMCRLEEENRDVLKCGRTHLQDAVPLRFSQEISGWRASLETDKDMILKALEPLRALAIGGTAVGTGLNAPEGFDRAVAAEVSRLCGSRFTAAENKFHALAFKDELVFAHGALKALACDLMKIANDIRWLAGGPRCGLGEITIPANEPGSSIMPGKVNPTQCEAVTMVAAQVMGNDVTIGLAASQGNFELNVYMPVCIYDFLQSVRLLADAMRSFDERCVSGIRPVREKMQEYLERSLMLVTVLSPRIGYEKAAEIAQKAHREDLSLREACLALGYLSEGEFDAVFRPEEMV